MLIYTDDFQCARMLEEMGHEPTMDYEDAHKYDAALFSGGEDVNPRLYGERSPQYFCRYSEGRDNADLYMWNLCTNREIPMIGICRGMQFLAVMNGNKLWHDLTRHAGTRHSIHTHFGKREVNSYHHQGVRLKNGDFGNPLAWCELSEFRRGEDDEIVEGDTNPEYESIVWENTKSFGVQFHPEYVSKNDPIRKVFYELLEESGVMKK